MKANPLLIVAGVFAASFAGRAIGIADAALNAPQEKTDKEKVAEHAPGAETATAEHAPEPGVKAAPHGGEAANKARIAAPSPAQALTPAAKATHNNKLLEAIEARAASLNEKARTVEDRIRTLEIIETRIEEKLAELTAAKDDLAKLVSYAEEASREDIAMLAKMYEQMKPKRAGEIFDQMAPSFAAGFLTEMNSESAALILTNMSTDKAYQASMIIASRNAAVHQE